MADSAHELKREYSSASSSPPESKCTSVSPSTSTSPSSSENEVPPHTSDWDRNLIDKLSLIYQNRSPSDIVLEHLSLFVALSKQETEHIDNMVETLGCDTLDCESLEQITSEKALLLNNWTPKNTSTSFKEINISRFSTDWEKFGLTLAFMISNRKADSKFSEAKYRCLLEIFLGMYGILTVSQPEIDVVKTRILDKKFSSKADILCVRSDEPHNRRNILAVCKVKNSYSEECCESDPSGPKRARFSVDITPTKGLTQLKIPIPDGLLAQHIGELFAYLEKSITEHSIMGMTMEKTYVTFTCLHVNADALKKIKDTKCGSVKLEEKNRPVFYYSEQYNFLNKDERKEIIRALLTLRYMEYRRAKKD